MNAVECCSLMDDNECSQVPWIPLSGCSPNVFVIVKVSVISMHCEGSKTLIEWKYEKYDGPMNGLLEIRDAQGGVRQKKSVNQLIPA